MTSPSKAPATPSGSIPSAAITVASLIVFITLWEVFGRRVDPVFSSYPSAILAAFWKLLQTGQLLNATWASLQSFIVGYLLSVVVGVPFGLLLGRSRIMEAALGVYITAGYAMPLVAFVPLLVLWFGLGFTVKAAVVFLMCAFPICINTWLGVREAPKALIEVGRSLVAPSRVILWRIILPATLPYITAALKLAIGRGVVSVVIAEFFTVVSGLGGIIVTAGNNFDTATMFVPIILLMVLAWLLNWAMEATERWLAPWQAEIAGRA
jgi:NitT/TauT family transport system permease protein